MANRLSMKTAPEAAVVEESAAIPTTPEKLMIDIPEGTDPEVVKAALASLMGLLDEDSLRRVHGTRELIRIGTNKSMITLWHLVHCAQSTTVLPLSHPSVSRPMDRAQV